MCSLQEHIERDIRAREAAKQDYATGIHISFGPEMKEVIRRNEGDRWCFHCRKRREFFYIVTAPATPSYYGPNADIQCGHCGTSDGDLFPGREREWE